jgi:hypothetical protein
MPPDSGALPEMWVEAVDSAGAVIAGRAVAVGSTMIDHYTNWS